MTDCLERCLLKMKSKSKSDVTTASSFMHDWTPCKRERSVPSTPKLIGIVENRNVVPLPKSRITTRVLAKKLPFRPVSVLIWSCLIESCSVAWLTCTDRCPSAHGCYEGVRCLELLKVTGVTVAGGVTNHTPPCPDWLLLMDGCAQSEDKKRQTQLHLLTPSLRASLVYREKWWRLKWCKTTFWKRKLSLSCLCFLKNHKFTCFY